MESGAKAESDSVINPATGRNAGIESGPGAYALSASSSVAISSTWQNPLPSDEIARQEQAGARLLPGMEVELRSLGRFIYGGVWDTMHLFYPCGDSLPDAITDGPFSRYVKRDMTGRMSLRIPYTLLADYII